MTTPTSAETLTIRAVYAARLADEAHDQAAKAQENTDANRAKIDARVAVARALGLKLEEVAALRVEWPDGPAVLLEADGLRFMWREYMDRWAVFYVGEGKCGHDLEATRWSLEDRPDVAAALEDLGRAIMWAQEGHLCPECKLEEDGSPVAPYPPRPTAATRLLDAIRELIRDEVEAAIERHSGGYV